MQVARKAYSALPKSIGPGGLKSARSVYVPRKRTMAMLQVLKSRKDVFSPLSQRELFGGVEGPMHSETEVNTAARKCSGAADLAMHMLTLMSSHTCEVFMKTVQHVPWRHDRLFECNEVL